MKSEIQANAFNRNGFPHPVNEWQWRETHISWILLTGEYVYKIKKPVDFGFLDFSTLEKRKRCCELEVALNGRTANEWYLGVEKVCRDEQGLNLCERGELVDYAVKMKQFDPDALLLNQMQEDDSIGIGFFRSLGTQLAQFHEKVERADAASDWGSPEAVMQPVEENFRQIHTHLKDETVGNQLASIEQWSRQTFSQLKEPFQQRKQQGFIRACHGDLHLGNIAVIKDMAIADAKEGDKQPLLFDCIEFNESLRWIDSVSDLAFLLMDLQFRGFEAEANQVLNHYLDFSGDYDAVTVLRFYQVYRAMVRAKVALLRSSQGDDGNREAEQEFVQYLTFALKLTETTAPDFLITSGVSGSGKSRGAQQLAAELGALHFRSDVIRKQLAGLKPLQASAEIPSEPGEGIYSQHFSALTFDRLAQLCEHGLRSGYPVIADATFLSRRSRKRFLTLGKSSARNCFLIEFDVPYAELVRRVERRSQRADDASEATVAVLDQQLAGRDTIGNDERAFWIPACDGQGEFSLDTVLHATRSKNDQPKNEG